MVWRRVTQAVGLVMAVAEFTDSRISRRPVDPNVLLLAATLIGIPLAARGGGEK